MTDPRERDLDADLQTIANWGESALVTLMEGHELELLVVAELGPHTASSCMEWFHLPIRDASIPNAAFEAAWQGEGQALRDRLTAGQGVVVHCQAGLGRTGLVAARWLIELGESPAVALNSFT